MFSALEPQEPGPGRVRGDPAPRLSLISEGEKPLFRVTGLQKTFGATKALRDCSVELRSGEVHAILGENGSGKSTLVKILSGVHKPHGGEMEFAGKSVKAFASPRDASAAGVSTVFQEILVVGQQSVLTNIWLGTDGVVRRRRSEAERRRLAATAVRELVDVEDLSRSASSCTLSERQAVCVARALVRDPRVLILDEATSTLDVATRDRLFVIINRLRSQGVGVLFISHRMDEVLSIADRITVLRGGITVATLDREQATPRELVRLMTGLENADAVIAPTTPASSRIQERVLLRARQVQLASGTRPIDFEIRAGELVGLAGLEGHGQDAFLKLLGGVRRASGSVERLSASGSHPVRSQRDALGVGVAYLPRDRRDEAIFETRSIVDNFQIATVTHDRKRGLVRQRAARVRFERFVRELQIVAGKGSDPITSLSGGNQQKVVLARWLAAGPNVLLLNDPTRGVDIGAKLDMYRVLADAAAAGLAVVMLSTELVELIDLMDRVLVFREQALFREFARHELSPERLVASYFGQEHD